MQNETIHRSIRLENALAEMHDAEQMLLQVESSEEFQTFKRSQKLKYQDVLSSLRGLIYDLEQDSTQESLVS